MLTMRFAPPMAYPTFFGLYRLVNVTVPSESPVDGVTVLDVTSACRVSDVLDHVGDGRHGPVLGDARNGRILFRPW